MEAYEFVVCVSLNDDCFGSRLTVVLLTSEMEYFGFNSHNGKHRLHYHFRITPENFCPLAATRIPYINTV